MADPAASRLASFKVAGTPGRSPGAPAAPDTYPQRMHELAAGLAGEMGVDLCDPHAGLPDPDEPDGDLRVHRLYHDEAVRHGASCPGIEGGMP